MLLSGYFDRAQTHQNGVCGEETGAAAAESSESEERPAEPGENKAIEFQKKCFLAQLTAHIAVLVFSQREPLKNTQKLLRLKQQRCELMLPHFRVFHTLK